MNKVKEFSNEHITVHGETVLFSSKGSTVYDALLKNMSPELMANLIKCPPKNYQKTKCRAASCRECVASFLERNISDDDVADLIKQVMKNYYYIQI